MRETRERLLRDREPLGSRGYKYQVEVSEAFKEASVIAEVGAESARGELGVVDVNERNCGRRISAEKLRKAIWKITGTERSVRVKQPSGECFGVDT